MTNKSTLKSDIKEESPLNSADNKNESKNTWNTHLFFTKFPPYFSMKKSSEELLYYNVSGISQINFTA